MLRIHLGAKNLYLTLEAYVFYFKKNIINQYIPIKANTHMKTIVKNALKEANICLEAILQNEKLHDQIVQASKLLVRSFESKGKVISCGNGGSMCDAMHFAEELAGKFRSDRKALPALAISDPSFITCVGNDYSINDIFSRYVEAHLNSNDILFAISTSGKSPNVINAAKKAKAMGSIVISLTGKEDSELSQHSDIVICTRGSEHGWADRVQELHIKVIHILIELVEHQMFRG